MVAGVAVGAAHVGVHPPHRPAGRGGGAARPEGPPLQVWRGHLTVSRLDRLIADDSLNSHASCVHWHLVTLLAVSVFALQSSSVYHNWLLTPNVIAESPSWS